MIRRWGSYEKLDDQLEWLKIRSGKIDITNQSQYPAETQGPDVLLWTVQIPKEGTLEIEYKVHLSGQDGNVPSRIQTDYALLLMRSLTIFPSKWLKHLNERFENQVVVRIASPTQWPVFSSWPITPQGDAFLPQTPLHLLQGSIILGNWQGFELDDGDFYVRILYPSAISGDYAERQATKLAHGLLALYRFFDVPPDPFQGANFLMAITLTEPSVKESSSDSLLNTVLISTPPDHLASIEQTAMFEAVHLWTSGALRMVPPWEASPPAMQRWLSLGWTDYLAWRVLKETGRISSIQYWNHIRGLVYTLEKEPQVAAQPLFQVLQEASQGTATAKAHLAALLLDHHLRTKSSSSLQGILCYLLQEYSYFKTGHLLTEKEVRQAIAHFAGETCVEAYTALLQGKLFLQEIPELAGPPVGETQTAFTPDGVRLFYQWIDGPAQRAAIYLSDGPGLVPYDWMYTMAQTLKDHFDIAYLEQRGVGRSVVPGPGVYSVDAFINDIDVVREGLGTKRLTLIGHGWGGYCALAYAARYPERIDTLILLDPIPSFPRVLEANLALLSSTSRGVKTQPVAQRIHTYQEFSQLVQELVQKGAYGSDLQAAHQKLELAYAHYVKISLLPAGLSLQNTDILPTIIARDRLFEYDLLPELGAAQFPVLILHGEKNRV
ncbi:MAG: alpha/beta fold hydrolase, partial [Anaerolineae bacterium]|nr:alpha/beta fold hydrolase [Anaerolineae bacterium]